MLMSFDICGMEEHIFSVFYSWQSYIGGYANKSYIKDKIISAFNELSISIELLEDSRGSTGAPDIPNAILTKIGKSDIFICDVTPAYTLVVDNVKQRALPNPNVMFELGFAVRSLGWERIICICNEEYGSVEYLPFDISAHRIITYRKKDTDKKSVKSLCLTKLLSDIIFNYNDIVAKENEFDYKRHDIEIFEKMMSFVSEEEFINSITDFRSSGRFFKWYEKCWDYVQYFQDYPQNRFINSYLNDSYTKLSKALDDLKSLTCQICRAYNTKYWEYEEPENEYTQEELRDILMTQEYRKREIPYPDNNNSDEIRKYYDVIDNDEREIREVSDNVLRTYTIFRDCIKKELII
jgi:hypothetical protein